MRTPSFIQIQHGVSMIEVLVTIVILTTGMLGLAGLQSRLQVSEMESYQRSQALMLLEDMASRINTNRAHAASYATGTGSPLGTNAANCTATSTDTRQLQDSCEWQNALLGAAETQGNSKFGAMVGARGCVEDLGNNTYLITVAWQGLTPISAPPSSVACGANQYNGATGSQCTNDLCRRVLTTTIRLAVL